MAHDLILGCTNTSWSRGTFVGQEVPAKDPLTDKERERIDKLAQVEMLASRGDPDAQKLIVKINVALNALDRKARRGDAKAIRTLETLAESGLVTKIAATSNKAAPRIAMAGMGYNSHWRYSRPQLGEEDRAMAMEAGGSEREAILRHYDALGWGWNPFKSVYKGVRAVGRGIKRGAKATGHGLKSAALIVPQALAQPGFASALMHGDDLGATSKCVPNIFSYTAYRIPTEADLDDIHRCNLSSDQVLSGFVYTLVGKGIQSEKNIRAIVASIALLNQKHPDDRYRTALAKARKLAPYHHNTLGDDNSGSARRQRALATRSNQPPAKTAKRAPGPQLTAKQWMATQIAWMDKNHDKLLENYRVKDAEKRLLAQYPNGTVPMADIRKMRGPSYGVTTEALNFLIWRGRLMAV